MGNVLCTERLVLRPMRDTDIDRILEFHNLPEVTRWLLTTSFDADQLRTYLTRAAQDPDDHGKVVTLDGLLIGTVSLRLSDGLHQPGAPSRSEAWIGYTFDPAYGGHGYAIEAVTALTAHAFDDLGIRRVIAGCYADNLPSVRLLEKLGMRREQHGILDSWHTTLGWVDGYTYALLADEWHQRPAP